MPSHAELANRLLLDAAGFFRTIGAQNPKLKNQMGENATVFEQIADLLKQNPSGSLDGKPISGLAASLLKDAGSFFRALGEQNAPLKEQMEENASIYDKIAELLNADPAGSLD